MKKKSDLFKIKNVFGIILDKVFDQIKNLESFYNISKHNKKYFKEFEKYSNKRNKNVIFIELYGDCSGLVAFSYLANLLAKKHDARIIAVMFMLSTSKFHRFAHYVAEKFSLSNYSVYKSFNCKKFIRVLPELKIKTEIHIKDKNEILKLKYKNVLVGDLIYDSYLRFNSKATIDINDIHFKNYLVRCYAYFDSVYELCNKYNVKASVNSHSVYLGAFTGRLVAKMGGEHYCSGITHIAKFTDKEFILQRYEEYKNNFKTFSEEKQKICLEKTKKLIHDKISGKESSNMENLKFSPFSLEVNSVAKNTPTEELIKESKRIKVLIASHCFSDSPHGFGNWYFPDFTEWLNYLGEISNETDYDWYFKPHPNNVDNNKDFIENFLNKYKKIKLIPITTSHHDLKNKIDFVVTVWGNIAMDLAALNINVINTITNGRFSSFNFNINPKTFQEYDHLLRNLSEDKKIEIDQNELYKCYYMHNIEYGPNIFVKDYVSTIRKLGWENKIKGVFFKLWLSQIDREKHYSIINNISEFINTKHSSFKRMK